jgi:hypothetical protein
MRRNHWVYPQSTLGSVRTCWHDDLALSNPRGLSDSVYDGWAASTSLTFNSWNWISNEFSYTREQTKFILEGFSVVVQPDPLPPLAVHPAIPT